MDHDYRHPERRLKGLLMPDPPYFRAPDRGGKEHPMIYSPQPPIELCWACGWSTYNQAYSGYDPRVKIMYTRHNLGLWQIGPRWVLRDEPNDFTLSSDFATQEYLRNIPNLDIPILKRGILLSEPEDQVQLSLVSRAPGQVLDHIWLELSKEQKAKYISELATYIRRWRAIQSPVMEKVNHEELHDIIIGQCFQSKHPPSCKRIGHTIDTWFDNLSPELRKGIAKQLDTEDSDKIEMHLQELKANFPKGYPNVMTHGDLHLGNIIVHNGKISAILDWEVAGFYPSWAEAFLLFQSGDSKETEMINYLFSEGCLDFSYPDYRDKIKPGLMPVIEAWKSCEVEHPDHRKSWYKPAFCDCKNYGGTIGWNFIGNVPEHRIVEGEQTYHLAPYYLPST